MHIVFLSPHSDPLAKPGEPDSGGQCVYEHQLALALSRFPNIRVTIFCRQKLDHPSSELINPNYIIQRIPCGPDGFIPKEFIEPVLIEFSTKVSLYLNDSKDDLIIHGHYWDGAKAMLQTKQNFPKASYIWTPHSLGYLKRNKFKGISNETKYNFIPRLLWENYVGLLSNKIIVSTETEKNTLSKFYLVNPDKIIVLPPGIQTSMFVKMPTEIVRRKYNLPQNAKILLCLGRITESKGYHNAIKALKILKRKYKQPVYLLICGGSSDSNLQSKEEILYLSKLQNLARRLKISDFVIFRPAVPHDKINEIYSCVDVLLITSENEPFGITVLEAMAMKIPIVSNFGEGPSNLIIHNQTGCLVNIDYLDRYSNYIYALLLDESYNKKIVTNANQFIHNNFDWEIKVKDFIKVYEKALFNSTFIKKPRKQLNSYFLKKNLN